MVSSGLLAVKCKPIVIEIMLFTRAVGRRSQAASDAHPNPMEAHLEQCY